MHPAVRVMREAKRGCGWRKSGAIYLVSDGPATGCGRLPVPLGVCPCCGAGIAPSRGWTWVDGDALLSAAGPCPSGPSVCRTCPIGRGAVSGFGRCGLIWVGESFYRNPAAFLREAAAMGVSRRVGGMPNGFVTGETWVLLAHRKAILTPLEDPTRRPMTAWAATPGVFRIFKPDRAEIIVTGDEPDSAIEGYLSRGLTPVKVVRVGEAVQGRMPEAG